MLFEWWVFRQIRTLGYNFKAAAVVISSLLVVTNQLFGDYRFTMLQPSDFSSRYVVWLSKIIGDCFEVSTTMVNS